ncbi:GNAT family N-acetyltransferase [Stappia stellulata]|uniref:GNAT family N-acetyltransferase n=1 Tax=Stappia stellulata TaxID=71235 RepID=UPI0003F77E12|nr:GNAT family N-acetyltransferase [Stappia stellulata]
MSEAGAFVVRAVERDEVDAVHALWLAAGDRGAWQPASNGADLLAELDVLAPEGRVWAAFQRRRPVAFAAAGELDGALWLSALGVDASFRGRGLARSLLAAATGYGQWAYYPALLTLAPRAQMEFLERFGFLRLDGERLDGGLRALADARNLSAFARRL